MAMKKKDIEATNHTNPVINDIQSNLSEAAVTVYYLRAWFNEEWSTRIYVWFENMLFPIVLHDGSSGIKLASKRFLVHDMTKK